MSQDKQVVINELLKQLQLEQSSNRRLTSINARLQYKLDEATKKIKHLLDLNTGLEQLNEALSGSAVVMLRLWKLNFERGVTGEENVQKSFDHILSQEPLFRAMLSDDQTTQEYIQAVLDRQHELHPAFPWKPEEEPFSPEIEDDEDQDHR